MRPFTQHESYSLTRSRTEPGKTPVRRRTRRDRENLQTLTSNPAPILKILRADRRWRLIITPAESERIVSRLTRDIDYPNFRASVALRPDQPPRGYDDHRMGKCHHRWLSDDVHPRTASAPASLPD
jgi:hypothetical protein